MPDTLTRHRNAYEAGERDGLAGEEPHTGAIPDAACQRLYAKGWVAGKSQRLICQHQKERAHA